jgi:hypothetical protein
MKTSLTIRAVGGGDFIFSFTTTLKRPLAARRYLACSMVVVNEA